MVRKVCTRQGFVLALIVHIPESCLAVTQSPCLPTNMKEVVTVFVSNYRLLYDGACEWQSSMKHAASHIHCCCEILWVTAEVAEGLAGLAPSSCTKPCV